MTKTICICGGGGLGHTVSGFLASRGYQVNMLSNRAHLWQQRLTIYDCNGDTHQGSLNKISAAPEEVVPESDIVLLAMPGYMIAETLEKIRPHLRPDSYVGSVFSSSGFFFFALNILPKETPIFGFQRVPFISRVREYGSSANITGFKKQLYIGVHGFDGTELAKDISEMFDTTTELLNTYLEAALSNSNPILHPARLFSLFKDYAPGRTYPEHFLFYEAWDEDSSSVLIQCDSEFQMLCTKLNIHIPSLLDYYEQTDARSLAEKIRSITSFKGMKAPMKEVSDGFVPDFENRYFTEDFPYGLNIIKKLASNRGIATPTIDSILQWAERNGIAIQTNHEMTFLMTEA